MIDLHDRLTRLRDRHLLRRSHMVSGPQGPHVVLNGKPVLLLCSDNYLGLADHDRVRHAAAEATYRWGAASGGSSLLSGNMTLHRRLEETLAEFLGMESAILFPSAYLANTGVIPAVTRRDELIFSDERNHASIVEGCRLSAAETFIYDHNDMDHLEWALSEAQGRGSLIVTHGIFSNDGDCAPLEELVELANRFNVRLMVDDSHGIGTRGQNGDGCVSEAGLKDEVDIVVGSLGKALGSQGGFVACERLMAKYLINFCRPLRYSTALAPGSVAAALAAVDLIVHQPELIERLHRNSIILRAALSDAGLPVAGENHITLVPVGSSARAARISEIGLNSGIFVEAVTAPTVPADAARIRLAPMSSHNRRELAESAAVLAEAATKARAESEAAAPKAVPSQITHSPRFALSRAA